MIDLSKEQKAKVRDLVAGGATPRLVAKKFSSRLPDLRKAAHAYAKSLGPIITGRIEAEDAPERHGEATFLFTAAQNNTHIHRPFWTNLRAFAAHIGAEIHVSKFAYDTNVRMTEHKPGTAKPQKSIWYPPEIADYVSDRRIKIAPDLLWVGKMNVLPTASRPLSSLESMPGPGSGIFPHPKHQLESLPRMLGEPPRFNYTTGAVTQINYIQRKAGQKAEFHHIYGALLVEVDAAGRWWARHINANADGSFQDLDRFVSGGKVRTGRRIEAVVFGDIHYDEIDDENMVACWGSNGVVERLHPRRQVLHDILNMGRRSHHDRDDPVRMFELWRDRREDVETEIEALAAFLRSRADSDGGEIVVVDSNHDRALHRWLKETTPKQDLANAQYWIKLNGAVYGAMAEHDDHFHLLEYAARDAGCPKRVRFLREDESYLIDGVEHGLHGDRGPNGSRGSMSGFLKMGRKMSVGHSHSAQILDGVFVAGTSSKLRLSYNTGPSSWSHSHILQYPSSKRTILTVRDGHPWRP